MWGGGLVDKVEGGGEGEIGCSSVHFSLFLG